MAYKYEKVNQQLLVPQIEDQLLMYIQEKNIAIGSKLPSEYKLAKRVADDPLGFAQLEDKYRLAMELFEVRILLEPEVAVAACRNATEDDKKHIKELCDEVERLYLEGKNHIQKDMEFHEAIAKCSGNRVVEVLIPVILTAITTFANLTNRKLQKETIETHRAITDAMLQGDSMGVKCAMIMHLTYNRQMLMEMTRINKSDQTS